MMYQGWEQVLLDIDADFLLDADYGWRESSTQHLGAHLAISGAEVGRALKRFIKKNTVFYLCVDHHEALYWWDTHIVWDALCYHVDGHHDLWNNGIEDYQWPGANRKIVDCGSYLNQAVRDGMVGKVVYVPGLFRNIRDERDDIDVALPCEFSASVSVNHWNSFRKLKNRMPKADIVTIAISPEWMPKKFWSEIEDLCTEIGVHPKMISVKKKIAFKRWKQLEKTNHCDCFYFPYDGCVF